MGSWEELDRAEAPGGGELILYTRAGEYMIRVNGLELMGSRAHASEETLAELACHGLRELGEPRVLVGGLGMGYTLRAALDELPPGARVIAAELVPAVAAWNRGPLGGLAGHPLADPRVELVVGDVAEIIAGADAVYDAIILDVDNGPAPLTSGNNHRLYSKAGLAGIRRALRSGGSIAIWAASPDAPFASRMAGAGFLVEEYAVPARGVTGDPEHVIYLGRLEKCPRISKAPPARKA